MEFGKYIDIGCFCADGLAVFYLPFKGAIGLDFYSNKVGDVLTSKYLGCLI